MTKGSLGFPVDSVVKNPHANAGAWETQVGFLHQEDTLEKEMATHFSMLAWRIPWTENPMDSGSWWATVYGVSKSQTQLNTHADKLKLPLIVNICLLKRESFYQV